MAVNESYLADILEKIAHIEEVSHKKNVWWCGLFQAG